MPWAEMLRPYGATLVYKVTRQAEAKPLIRGGGRRAGFSQFFSVYFVAA